MKLLAAVFALFVLAYLLVPREQMVAPIHHVAVVTHDLRPVRNAHIRQIITDHSLGRVSMQEAWTDEFGMATLEATHEMASPGAQILGCMGRLGSADEQWCGKEYQVQVDGMDQSQITTSDVALHGEHNMKFVVMPQQTTPETPQPGVQAKGRVEVIVPTWLQRQVRRGQYAKGHRG